MIDSQATLGALSRIARVKPEGSDARVDVSSSRRILERPVFAEELMEEVCSRENMMLATRKVISNGGSPGVDGMKADDLAGYLKENWSEIRSQLLLGHYHPQAIKRVEIPKPGSKEKRKLGIPCCLDRVIQQALLQVLQAEWDPHFSEFSFGFRPGRSCHQAIAQAQSYIEEGYEYVVDIDLSKFFDRVCHDRLMSRLMQDIKDKRVLKLIRRYLCAGIFENGVVSSPSVGTPQGGPLSPWLSNVVLDELDRELESRGHKFVRYADDCNIYVKSRRSGERVMSSMTVFIEKRLKLKVNMPKSAVDRPQKRKFLGFSFTGGRSPNRRKISDESIRKFKSKVRALTKRNHSVSLRNRIVKLNYYLRGWRAYYGFAEAQWILRELDGWIRRRLRSCQWKSWKVYKRRKAELLRLGCSPDQAQSSAWSPKGPWRMSHVPGVRMALNNRYFDRLGLFRLSQ